MTTSALESTGGPDADSTVGANVHALLWRSKTSQAALALALDLTPSVLSKKMRGDSAWSARQIAATAAFLDVDPGRLFRESSLPKVAPNLSVVQGEGRKSSRHSMHNRPLLTTVTTPD